MRLPPARTPLLLVAGLLAGAAPTAGQELVHHAQDVESRLTQTVRLLDAWEDAGPDAFFRSEPLDVETRVGLASPGGESTRVELLLHGEWGWFLFSYAEVLLDRDLVESSGLRTLRRTVDLDGDGQREILLIERRASTRTALDSTGDPLPGARPRYAGHEVALRYLARVEGSLLENTLAADPDDPAFGALLELELGAAVNAALQLAAGDFLFNAERYPEAGYRYRVAREWAERALPARFVADLTVEAELLDADPDDPAFTWITAVLRHRALPPYYRRRY
jgi:hypothetical protein